MLDTPYKPGDLLSVATSDTTTLELAVEIVAAYVAHNSVAPADLPSLIRSVHDALAGLGKPVAEGPTAELPTPAVAVKKSITPDHILSLIDGKPYRSLKRHIGVHGYTPDSYRSTFGLPSTYPMVCSSYAAKRSELAKSIGLGQKRRKG